ncbi:TORTIFOLIA1-like protein 4 [Cornus florida]|uniref:TORTIFOLIA1-like protein 4 n=1 Tax=Cornus florida TaxID=4283 RepID=UPI0028A145FA|nr:TORTIFOLIA1-like protein 4 [Cornus florida]
MSLPKRHSSSPPQDNLKHRVITCLNKLSDRDTLAVATTELESIARNLTHDAFSPFLTCLSTTDSSEKSPVRRQCVRLLGLLSAAHGDALSPHLSKMMSGVLRRLRDPDSAVRSACVDAVASMASQITKPPFSSFLKPLVEAISVEQDYNSQIGSSLCLAAAIEASPDPDSAQLQKLLPKLLKLVKSDCFKAKPALLSLVGSIVSAGGASNRGLLNCLVPCLIEFLSSEDWAARKAAAEALARLALAERNASPEFRSSCLASLESRRFDRVKVVRETMNRSLELWKEVPAVSEEVVPQFQVKSSPKDNSSRSPPPVTKSSPDEGFETPQQKKNLSNRMPLLDTVTSQRSPPKSSVKKPLFCKLDNGKPFDRDVEVAVPQPPSLEVSSEERVSDPGANGSCRNLKPETKRVLINKTCDEKLHKFGGLRSGCRVVPFYENDDCDLDVVESNAAEEDYGNQKEAEDLSLICKQLVQIQNQQFSLFDLLQRFIGSSQSGMNSLETRVNGLEKALDEISCNLAVSTGRMSNTDSAGNSCCMLPGAEFLSPKFWRRTEGHTSSSRFSFYGRHHSPTVMRNMPNKDANTESIKLDSTRGQHYGGGGSVVNPMPDTRKDSRGNLESFLNRTPKKTQDAESIRIAVAGGLDGASYSSRMTSVNISSR